MIRPTSTRTTITEATGAPRLGLRSAIDSWGLSLRTANRSAATIKTYPDAAEPFERYLAAQGMPVALGAIRHTRSQAVM